MLHHSPIRIATLGYDPALAELIDAVRRSDRFELVAWDEAQAAGDTSSSAQRPISEENWEDLLSGAVADWVAASQMPRDAAAATLRAEQLKRLVQAGVPLVLVHPACDMLLGYELEMNRGDGGGPMCPYRPTVDHPVLQALFAEVRSGARELGQIEQFLFERFAAPDQRQQADVLDHVARDSLIVRRLLGDISSVSASGVPEGTRQWANLGIHFTGPAEPMARWSIGPMRDAAGLKLTLIGRVKTISIWIPDAGHDVELSEPFGDMPVQAKSWRPADEFLQRIAAGTETEAIGNGIDWNEICRSLEVTDAIQRSVARKRAIELYHEQVTEQDTFKSMMAAGGCGMLLWVLMLLMLAGLVEGLQLPLRDTFVWRLWPVFLFAPLAAFLALQLLQFVFPRQTHRNNS